MSWNDSNGTHGITYSAYGEYRNRKSNSVEVRLKWTNTLTPYCYYGYAQTFRATFGGKVESGHVAIASGSTWSSMGGASSRSATAYTPWKTVSVDPQTRTLSMTGGFWDDNKVSKNWSGSNLTIPTY